MLDLRRREFITLLGGAAAAWPVAAPGQQGTMPVVGYLSGATFEMTREYVAAFHQGLADAGFAEGRNVAVEYRWADGHNERLPALATDLVRREVAVIAVGGSTPGALAAKSVSDTIPVVFLIGTDPVKVGLIASLARPGGNVTGITILNVELLAKGLEFAQNVVPQGNTIAVLVNPSNLLQAATERGIIQSAARALGARLLVLDASSSGEIKSAFGTLISERAAALVVSGEVFFLTQRARLIELAAQHAIPTIYAYREYTTAGGLMSYGGSLTEMYREIGAYTGRILKGEKAADLPVQQVTKVELVINLKTAKALGLTLPDNLLARADVVIE